MVEKTFYNQRTAAASIAYKFSDVIEFDSSFFTDARTELENKAELNEVNLFGQQTKLFNCEQTENMLGVLFGAMKAGAVASGFLKDTGALNVNKLVERFAANDLPAVFYLATEDANVCNYEFAPEVAVAYAANAQEAIDFSVLAHLTIGKSYKPFVVCLNNKKEAIMREAVELPDNKEINELFDVVAFCGTRARGLKRGISCDIEVPVLLDAQTPEIVSYYLDKINQQFGRSYKAVEYVGADDAKNVFVSFGAQTPVIEEAVLKLVAAKEKVGLVKIKLLAPFCAKSFHALLPKTVKQALLVGQSAGSCQKNAFFQSLKVAAPTLTWVEDAYALGANTCTVDYICKAYAAFTDKAEPCDNKYWTSCMDGKNYVNDMRKLLELGEKRWVVANSLLENNVDFGLGMLAAWEQRRNWILNEVLFLADNTVIPSVSARGYEYLDVKDDPEKCDAALLALLDDHVRDDTHCSTCTNIRSSIEFLHKKYFWIYAGDSRDCTLDWKAIARALATGENVNLFAVQPRTIYKKAAEHTGNLDAFFACNQAQGVCAKTITLDLDKEKIERLLHQAELYEGPSIVVLFA